MIDLFSSLHRLRNSDPFDGVMQDALAYFHTVIGVIGIAVVHSVVGLHVAFWWLSFFLDFFY